METVIFVITILTVIFWRDVVKIMLMAGLLLSIVFIVSGAVVIIDVLQHVIK